MSGGAGEFRPAQCVEVLRAAAIRSSYSSEEPCESPGGQANSNAR
jgi:hypothetical protein